jgi:hypothetical protein
MLRGSEKREDMPMRDHPMSSEPINTPNIVAKLLNVVGKSPVERKLAGQGHVFSSDKAFPIILRLGRKWLKAHESNVIEKETIQFVIVGSPNGKERIG